MLKIAQKRPKFPCFLSLVYRSQSTRVLTVCQQHAQKVLAHCANSRISASVSTPSVLTVDMSVPTLERDPWPTACLGEVTGGTPPHLLRPEGAPRRAVWYEQVRAGLSGPI